MKPHFLSLLLVANLAVSVCGEELATEAARSLRKGAEFFRTEVGQDGRYLWQYSQDLTKREGEGKAALSQGWVQPPGTPAVGMAFLKAWEATDDRYFLDSAREAAHALLEGQLQSGGWQHSFETEPKLRQKVAYRDGKRGKGRNTTTFDDDSTQAAIRFLARTDAALEFKDKKIHEAVGYALRSVIKAQYPNGAWPQGYDRFPEPDQFPVMRASYQESWPREWPGSKEYWLKYTLNDNALATLIETLLEVHEIYESSKGEFADLAAEARAAASKAGDFLLLSRMPEPQPIWGQQYDFQMHPSWARKFEPPSVTAGESQNVLETLLDLYAATGDRKFLEPIPRALEFLRSIRLPDGQLARFYELKTSKPLYFTRDYKLTYDDSDVPTHYSFKVSDRTDAIEREYRKVLEDRAARLSSRDKLPTEGEIRSIIDAQEEDGRWVEDGRLRYHGGADSTRRVIRCATFIRNMEMLSRFVAAAREVL